MKGTFLSAALGCSDAPKENTDPEHQRAADDYLGNGVDELATHEPVADEGDGNGDLENEINRLQIEHQSAENKHKLAQESLALETHVVGTKRNSAFGAMSKSNRKLKYLARLLHW